MIVFLKISLKEVIMDWKRIITLYPFVKELAEKLPGLRKSIEMSGVQLKRIKRTIKPQKSMEIAGFTTAKLLNPNVKTTDILKARKWALEVYKAIHA